MYRSAGLTCVKFYRAVSKSCGNITECICVVTILKFDNPHENSASLSPNIRFLLFQRLCFDVENTYEQRSFHKFVFICTYHIRTEITTSVQDLCLFLHVYNYAFISLKRFILPELGYAK